MMDHSDETIRTHRLVWTLDTWTLMDLKEVVLEAESRHFSPRAETIRPSDKTMVRIVERTEVS